MSEIGGVLRPVTALLLATLIQQLGNGLIGVLIPLAAKAGSLSEIAVGFLGSCYFTGFVLGCVFGPSIIARVGHIRAFTAFAAVLTTSILLHSLLLDVVLWALARFIAGLCFAGIFTVLESWLAGAASIATRGRVMSVYLMVHQVAMTVGMQLIGLPLESTSAMFVVVAMLFSLGAVPIALTGSIAPPMPKKPKLRIGWLMTVSPAAAIGCFLIGLANSAFFTLAPLYISGAGLDRSLVAVLLAMALLSGAAFQIPIGAAADARGRRPMLVLTSLVSATGGIILFLVANASPWWIAIAMFGYGASTFSIWGLSVAHANDLVHKKRAVEVSSGLLLIYSIGAVAGPSIAATMMHAFGHGGLFVWTAICHATLASVVFVRWQLRPVLPRRRRRRFLPVTKVTTPAIFELDPRAEPPDLPMAPAPGGSGSEPATPREAAAKAP